MRKLFICLILILLAYQNCTQINLLPLNSTVDIDSIPDDIDEGAPPPMSQSSYKNILLCESKTVDGKLRYYSEILDLETQTITNRNEVGHCNSLVVADINGDGDDEWLHSNSNSIVNPCKLEVYNGRSGELLKQQDMPGTVVLDTPGSPTTMCTGYPYKYAKEGASLADTIIYLYDHSAGLERGMQILSSLDLNIIEQKVFSNNQSKYVFNFTKDINSDGKPEALSYVPGYMDASGNSMGFSFELADGVFPISNFLHTWNLPMNHLPLNAVSLDHPTEVSKYILSTDIQQIIPSGGGTTNQAVSVKIEAYNASTYVKEVELAKDNVIVGGSNFQYLFNEKADFNGDGREDAVFSQGTGQYSGYTEILDGRNLNVLVKIDRAWVLARSSEQSISEQVVYLGSVDFNNDNKQDIALKYYSFNGSKTFLLIVSATGEVFLEKELSTWGYTKVYGLKSK